MKAVVPLHDKCKTIPDQLRQWADAIDAGDYPPPVSMLFITDDGTGYELRAVGAISSATASYMLLRALGMML